MLTNGYIKHIVEYLVGLFGYKTVIISKDIILAVSFLSMGLLLALPLLARVMNKVRSVDSLGKMTSVSFKEDGKEYILTSTSKNFHQQIEFIVSLLFIPSWAKYSVGNTRRAKITSYIIIVILTFLATLGVILVTNPIVGMGLRD